MANKFAVVEEEPVLPVLWGCSNHPAHSVMTPITVNHTGWEARCTQLNEISS